MNVERIAKRVYYTTASLMGVDPRRWARSVQNFPHFVRSAAEYASKAQGTQFPLRLGLLYPQLAERGNTAGAARGHYFHQDIWAARKVFAARPDSHLDVGSRLDGFVAHLLSFMPVTVVDIRPMTSPVEGLTFIQEDATKLARVPSSSVLSLSSLHAVEHFGLGRYGDPIDPEATFAAMASLARVLKPGGRLYFSVPVGAERVEFNAHRVFSPHTVLSAFRGLELVSMAGVDDAGEFMPRASPEQLARLSCGCGLFEFTK